jgi:uncharacterized RDD family membrane protein YckC
MALHIHTIDAYKHRHFLAEERTDPITGDDFQAGDKVVFCAACKSAFLLETWQYMGENHCGQSRTLPEVPIAKAIVVKRRGRRSVALDNVYAANRKRRLTALAIDTATMPVVGLLIWEIARMLASGLATNSKWGMLFEGMMLAIGGIGAVAPFLLRDSRAGQGLGKRLMGIRIIDKDTGEDAGALQSIIRTLLLPTELLHFISNEPTSIADRISNTIIIND